MLELQVVNLHAQLLANYMYLSVSKNRLSLHGFLLRSCMLECFRPVAMIFRRGVTWMS